MVKSEIACTDVNSCCTIMGLVLTIVLATEAQGAGRAAGRLRHPTPPTGFFTWTPGQVTVGLDVSEEREIGFRQYELAPKIGWSPFSITLGRTRLGYETELSYSEERTQLITETSRTRTLSWNAVKLRLLALSTFSLEDHNLVPWVSIGVDRSEVRETGDINLSTSLGWGAGLDVEVGSGLSLSLGYHEAHPAGGPVHSGATAGLAYNFGAERASNRSGEGE